MLTILIVEDDKIVGQAAQRWLNKDNHVHWASTQAQALSVLDTSLIDIVILDLELPDGSGLDILAAIKRRKLESGVLIMTAYGDVDHRIRGLDMGADDYLVKPIDFKELDARIRAVKRRKDGISANIIEIGDIELDIIGKRASRNGEFVHLSHKENTILSILMQGKNRYFNKAMLEERLYGLGETTDGNAIEVHISSLRKKLGKTLIKTTRGLGYIIESNIRS